MSSQAPTRLMVFSIHTKPSFGQGAVVSTIANARSKGVLLVAVMEFYTVGVLTPVCALAVVLALVVPLVVAHAQLGAHVFIAGDDNVV